MPIRGLGGNFMRHPIAICLAALLLSCGPALAQFSPPFSGGGESSGGYSTEETDAAITAAVSTHSGDPTAQHGITDAALLALGVASATDGALTCYDGSGGKQLKECTAVAGAIINLNKGTSLPATCDQGDTFQETDGPDGRQLWLCVTSNTWRQQGTAPKDFTLPNPADGSDALLFRAQQAMTVTDIHCIVDPADSAESISLDLQECDATGDNCASVDAAITCDNDGAEDDGTLGNAAIDAGDWVKMVVGAPTGTVSALTFSLYWF